MDEDSIRAVMGCLGVRGDDLSLQNEWMVCRCPISHMTHEKGRDSRPSFYILVRDDGPSLYYCFGCSDHAEILSVLFYKVWLADGEYPWDAARMYHRHEVFGEGHDQAGLIPPLPEIFDSRWGSERSVASKDPIPDEIVERMPLLFGAQGRAPSFARRWLTEIRMISLEQIKRFRVRFNREHSVVVFPFTLLDSRPYMLRARKAGDSKTIFTLNHELLGHHSPFASRKDVGYWFGLHLVDWSKPVVLVEGEIDAMRLATLGIRNPVASGGTKVTDRQLGQILSRRVFSGYDRDKEGQRAFYRVRSYYKKSSVLYRLDWGLADRKDPGELESREELMTVLSGAEPA